MARRRVPKRRAPAFPKMQLSFVNRYNALLKVNIKHDFFNSGNFPRVNIRPSKETYNTLVRNNIQFRKEPSGFFLGYAETDAHSPIKDIKKPMQLSFMMEIDDPGVLNYTDLPYAFDETIYYFNNKALDKDETEYKNLSVSEFVTEDDKIDILPYLFQHDFDEPQEEGVEVQVTNAAEEVVFEGFTTEEQSKMQINLLGEPEGKYTLLIDGLEEYSFYLYSALKKVFGAIDIIVDKDELGDYSFFDAEGNVIVQDYNIHFKNRSVRWRYLLIEQNPEKQHSDHQIYDGVRKTNHSKIEFGEAEEEMGVDGNMMVSIWSEEPIPFKQSQLQQFKLKTKRGRNGVESMMDLPLATYKNDLKTNFFDPDEVYSELIVYL